MLTKPEINFLPCDFSQTFGNSENHKFAVPDCQIRHITGGFDNPPEHCVIY